MPPVAASHGSLGHRVVQSRQMVQMAWPKPRALVLSLTAVQAANAAFDAVALYPVAESTRWGRWAKQWAEEDLDRLEFPRRFRFVFPIVKAGSVAGLLIGLRRPMLGRLTAAAIVAYFLVALAFHARASDPVVKYAPAVGMLAWASLALHALGSDRT